MKARRDCQKVRKECKKHVSLGKKVLSCVLCELSGIPSSLSSTLQSFEVDHEEMTNTLSDAKQNNQRPQPVMQQQSRLLLLSSYTMGLAKDSVAELRLSLHNFCYCDDGLMLFFSGVVDVVIRLVPTPLRRRPSRRQSSPPFASSSGSSSYASGWQQLVEAGCGRGR
jgi:hypothetical protein